MSGDETNHSNIKQNQVSVFNKFETEEMIFFIIMLISIIGVAITEYAPEASWAYWVFMVVAFGTSALVIEKSLLHRKDQSFRSLLLTQVIHWGATLIAILLSFAFVTTGRMTHEASGLVILLILAMSTFLDGYHVGWRFYVAGTFLALTTILTAFLEEFMWILVVIAIAFVVFSAYLGKHLRTNRHKI